MPLPREHERKQLVRLIDLCEEELGTLTAVAELLGTDRQRLTMIRKGHRPLTRTLEKFARRMHIPFSYFTSNESPRAPGVVPEPSHVMHVAAMQVLTSHAPTIPVEALVLANAALAWCDL